MQINIFYNIALPKYYKTTAKYKKVMLGALGRAAAKKGELNLIVVGKKEIHKINKQYINHDYVTDVISFGYPFDAKSGGPFGDVFICFEQAKAQAKEQGHGALLEMLILAAHGTLHLVGYDDNTMELRNKMNAVAHKIAKQFL